MVETALGSAIEDKKVYFRAFLRKHPAQTILCLVPSFDPNCAKNRLSSWKANAAGKRLLVSSPALLASLELTEAIAKSRVEPLYLSGSEIRIPFKVRTGV
jgi:hypothetical protein